MEEARIEHCPRCGSKCMENHFYFETGEPVKIYVRCTDCGSFVARYTLSRYTTPAPYCSLLDNIRGPFCSGRKVSRMIEEYTSGIQEKFDIVVRKTREHESLQLIPDIIENIGGEKPDVGEDYNKNE